jgi:predicted transcriptional regulator
MSQTDLKELTATIVSGYLAANKLAAAQVPELITSVYQALAGAAGGAAPAAASAPQKLVPAVPIRKSITPDFLISLEDGRTYKSLKRHLRTAYDMSPEDYRAKWGLPNDYPMVAPNYAASRSALAKQMGLGRGGAPIAEAPEPAPVVEASAPAEPAAIEPVAAPQPAKRGRKPKVKAEA